jgi:hypothetical protein
MASVKKGETAENISGRGMIPMPPLQSSDTLDKIAVVDRSNLFQ